MIRKVVYKELPVIATMLMAMYKELFGEEASSIWDDYYTEAVAMFADPKQTILVDDKLRGFFVVMDISEPLLKTKRWQGTRVYIMPMFRKTRLLKEFYDYLFANFEGNIFGQTEINSEHIKVLEKRHDRIANVYLLRRN